MMNGVEGQELEQKPQIDEAEVKANREAKARRRAERKARRRDRRVAFKKFGHKLDNKHRKCKRCRHPIVAIEGSHCNGRAA